MYSKDVLIDRLNKCKAEVHNALEKAKTSGDAKDVDFFQNCLNYLVLLMCSLAYNHVENLLEIGAIKQTARLYCGGFLVEGQTQALAAMMSQNFKQQLDKQTKAINQQITATGEEVKNYTGELHDNQIAAKQAVSNHEPDLEAFKTKTASKYITCADAGRALCEDLPTDKLKTWNLHRGKCTLKGRARSVANRLAEILQKELKSEPHTIGKRKYYQLSHMARATFISLEREINRVMDFEDRHDLFGGVDIAQNALGELVEELDDYAVDRKELKANG